MTEIIKDEEIINEEKISVIETSNIPTFYNLPTAEQIKEYENFLKNYDSFVFKVLKDGIDYGLIPGVDKPTLLKPGAEKLEKLFSLRSQKTCVLREVKDDGSFIRYTYKTVMYNRAGQVVSTCEGTCNSKEKKYRSLTVYANKATDEQKEKGKKESRKGKNGSSYDVYVIDKPDFFDLENTIMKMAQKRSYVGAVLEGTNSSSRFTQDIESVEDVIDYGHDEGANQAKTPAKGESAGKKIDSVYEKCKKNLMANTEVSTLEDYRVKIMASKKYDDEQKKTLSSTIDTRIKEINAKLKPNK
jgi:hypothetical protein